jgi:hypothetical protein
MGCAAQRSQSLYANEVAVPQIAGNLTWALHTEAEARRGVWRGVDRSARGRCEPQRFPVLIVMLTLVSCLYEMAVFGMEEMTRPLPARS